MRIVPTLLIATLAILPATVVAATPVEVTRFHTGAALAPGVFETAAQSAPDGGTIEFRTHAIAVSRELVRLGYAEGASPAYTAEIGYESKTRERLANRSPVTIGIGGGTFGRHLGVGLGTSFGVGGSGSREIVTSQLSVRIKRKSDGQVVWEGRATSEASARSAAAQPGPASERLARALFTGFPGESGKTVRVR